MTCNEMDQKLMQYFDGELNDLDTYQLKQHVKSCDGCMEQYDMLSDIIICMEETPLVEPPEGFERRVMNKIEKLTNVKEKLLNQFLKVGFTILVTMLLIFSTWMLMTLQSISLPVLLSDIIRRGFVPAFVTHVLQVFQSSYKTSIIIGNSVFDIYQILYKNYSDVLIAMLSLMTIAYAGKNKHRRQI